MQGGAGEPAVDLEQLRAASGEDPEFMKDLINLYFQQAAEIMPGLAAALANQSPKDVNYLAHKLAGASLSCGMTIMVAPLRELETLGRKGDLTGANDFLARATANLETARAAVQEFLRGGKAG